MEADVIIIGGGPAGSTLGTLVAAAGHSAVIVERAVHPRDHVGELLTPSNNAILHRIGLLPEMDARGFAQRDGVGWTLPGSPAWDMLAIRIADYPPPRAVRQYGYNVERSDFDDMLLRHARTVGVKVLQGVTAKHVLFDHGRAYGVRVQPSGGPTRDLVGRFVVDASGRRCLLGNQLGLKQRDHGFSQCAMYSWFGRVGSNPSGYERFAFFHLLDLERAWVWHIPLRDGVCSIGVVADRTDFKGVGHHSAEFFARIAERNRTLKLVMAGARQLRPWRIEGDYSYRMHRIAGDGWLAIGDASRFVDPVFSSGVDVAMHSAAFAYDTILPLLLLGDWSKDDERFAFARYEERVGRGVDLWQKTIELFYGERRALGRLVADEHHHPDVARVLQGNPYEPQYRAIWERLLHTLPNVVARERRRHPTRDHGPS
jgi:flavin-dependent dehydrogenase